MRHMPRFKFFLFAPLILVALVLFGYVTMLLWNELLPVLFHFPLITFWQAVGLLILTRLLFGNFCHRGHGPHRHWGHDFRNKWETMTPEEREQFLKMRNTCRPPWGRYSYEKKEEGSVESGSSNSVK